MRIELRDIHKHFGPVIANDGISLSVEPGTIHGLLGENGAGKTTLMKILSGYQTADSGTLLLDGRPVRMTTPEQAIAAGIGMLHQDPLDVPALSVLDNYSLGHGSAFLQQRGHARHQLREVAQRFAFDLNPEALVGSLTVGERQQLELLRLLSLGVRTIILDEPTTGISASQKTLLFATLHELAAEDYSLIFVSHKLEEIEQLCSQATVLRQGRVVGQTRAPFTTDQLVALMFGQCLGDYPRVPVDLGEPILALQDLAIHTYRLNVEHLSLEVRAGEVIGLAGLEGSGQRIMMQACAGLVRSRAGRLSLAGEDMTRASYRQFLARGVAFVPAARLEEGMVGGLTIREHMALCGARHGLFVDWGEAQAQASARIAEYNIVGRPDTMVQELSGGNQQRALLALLPANLRLLLLEHPTRGLDIESTRWVWSRLLERRLHGTAILYTSTDLDELVEHSDRIVVFSGGHMSRPMRSSEITCDELGYLIGGKKL
jgi:simple sugar transport system ATP-binding protein